MTPKKIEEETVDRIVLVDSVAEIDNLLAIAVGSFFLYAFLRGFIDLKSDADLLSSILVLSLIIIFGLLLIDRLYDLLVKGTVTIDKRFPGVIIKRRFF
jgi:hypothetical protein